MLPDRSDVSQMMMGFDETVEEPLLRSATDLTHVQGTNVPQRPLDGRPGQQRGFRSMLTPHELRNPFLGRKLDEFLPVKLQEKATSDHVPGSPVGLNPTPGSAELQGEGPTARTGTVGDESPDLLDVVTRDDAAPISNFDVHTARVTGAKIERKSPVKKPAMRLWKAFQLDS